jgi:hypothetical protein
LSIRETNKICQRREREREKRTMKLETDSRVLSKVILKRKGKRKRKGETKKESCIFVEP